MAILFQNSTGRTLSGQVGSRTVILRPEDQFSFDDVCSLADFTNETFTSIADNAAGEAVQDLNQQAEAAGCAHRFNIAPVVSSDSQPSDRLGAEGDSAQEQGSPRTTPSAQVTTDPRPYGGPGESRLPTQAIYDQVDPRPQGEVWQGLTDDGMARDEADNQIDRALRGEPPKGERRTSHTGDRSTQPSAGGDPVDLYSGALVIHEVDLEVPTPFYPMRFERIYRSGKPFFGPFGFGWDHNWNIFLRELNDGGIARATGMLHEDVFSAEAGGWKPPRGVYEFLEVVPGPAVGYQLRGRGGLVREFSRPPGWTDLERIPLVRIFDRSGNQIQLDYDAQNRLQRVSDDDGRALYFIYGECGLLEGVRDHTTREVQYLHDQTREHLISVRMPATPSDPAGSLFTYEYAHPSVHPAQRHNIVRAFSPDGASIMENEFGEDPGEASFNRVLRQVQGEYFYEFEYSLLQWLPNVPEFRDEPCFQTTAQYPDGSFWTYTFNPTGDLIDERFRLAHDKSFRVVIRKLRYDSQGNVTEELVPDGSETLWTHDDTNADPIARDNLLIVEQRAPPTRPAPSRTVFRAEFEPLLQMMRRVRHENGTETRFLYDFDLTPAASSIGLLRRIDWPDCTLPDGSVQSGSTRFEYNSRGQPIALVSPEGIRDEVDYFPSGSSKAGFRRRYRADVTGCNEITAFDFDAAGFPESITSPAGHVTSFTHDALGRRTSEGLPAIGSVSDLTEWDYHWQGTPRCIRRPRGEYQDGVVSDWFIEDRFGVNPLGHIEQRVVGANTATPRIYRVRTDFRGRPVYVTAPNGVTKQTCFDERGRLLFATDAEGTNEALTTRFVYDPNGRLTKVEYPGDRVSLLEYDSWGRIRIWTSLNGTRQRTAYNTFNLPDSVELEGSPGDGSPDRLLRRASMRYDERGRQLETTVWQFETDPSAAVGLTETKWYDRDGLCTRRLTPTGAAWHYTHDGRGRLLSTTDPLGNIDAVTYGLDGLPERVVHSEAGPVGPLVAHGDHEHDARGRLIRTTTHDGQETRTRFDARNLAVELVGPDGLVTLQSFGLLGEILDTTLDPGGLNIRNRVQPDAMGRAFQYIDGAGEPTTVVRDLHGRVLQIQLANGQAYRRDFDASGDLIQVETPDGSAVAFTSDGAGRTVGITATPGGERIPIPAHSVTYDGLDRPVQVRAGAEVVSQRYDSLDRLIREETSSGVFSRHYDDLAQTYWLTTSDGRRERHELDVLGRVRRIVLEDAGTSPLSGLSAPAGSTLLDVLFQGRSRVARLTHVSGVQSDWTHDPLGRLTEVRVGFGPQVLDRVIYRSDENNRRCLIQHVGMSARNTVYSFDARGRLVRSRTGFAFPQVPDVSTLSGALAQIAAAEVAATNATNETRYQLAPADTRSVVTVIASGVSTANNYVWDSAHELTQAGSRVYSSDPDGSRISGDGLTYRYDALGRLREVLAGSTRRAALEYDPLGRLARLQMAGRTERSRYLGPYRLRVDDDLGVATGLITRHPNLPSDSHAVTAGGRLDLHYNGHNDLVLLTDAAGATTACLRYDDFGWPTILDAAGNPAATIVAPLVPTFGGMPFVVDAELYLTAKRPYDPRTGLFLARDPLLYFSSPNPYVFALHDPVNALDPSGEIAPLLVAGFLCGGVGLVIGAASVVIRGGEFDAWDVISAGAIGFGAGFISGVTFGAAAEAIGGVALAGATIGGATGTATGAAATASLVSGGLSVGAGVSAGSVAGLASGAFSGFGNASYQWIRHGGDYWSMVGQGVAVEGVSGMVGGAIGGGIFAGAMRLGALPTGQGYWASLSGQSTRRTMQDMAPTLIARGLGSPYGAGAVASGFGGGYGSGVTARLLNGETASDAFSDAVTDGLWGAGAGSAGATMHPTSWMYWRSRFSPIYAARIEQIRGVAAHHQRNVAKYPELATPNLSRKDLTWFEEFYGTNIVGGNLRGRFSEFENHSKHIELHNLWRFGKSGRWLNVETHGPWTPIIPVYLPPVDPRSESHTEK